MALVKEFTDERGVVYSASYWKIAKIYIDVDKRRASWSFNGYKNQEAKELMKAPIGNYFYFLEDNQFDLYMQVEDACEKNIRTIMYEWSKSYKDVLTGEWITEGEGENVHSVQVKVSFFENAIDA